ncbi:MAG TPA: hypothetical protein PLF50_01900 [Candidatus Cloacimonadota bacterium]|nr:hypothetical protein [Candidatus Cloacimonadota bacterium]
MRDILKKVRFKYEYKQFNSLLPAPYDEVYLDESEWELEGAKKIGPKFHPEIYRIWEEVKAAVGFEEPTELFLFEGDLDLACHETHDGKAITSLWSIKSPHRICLSERLTRLLDDNELRFALGQEAGKLAYRHILIYLSTYEASPVPYCDSISMSTVIIERIFDRIRCFSSDRAGCLACPDPYAAVSAMCKLTDLREGKKPERPSMSKFIRSFNGEILSGNLNIGNIKGEKMIRAAQILLFLSSQLNPKRRGKPALTSAQLERLSIKLSDNLFEHPKDEKILRFLHYLGGIIIWLMQGSKEDIGYDEYGLDYLLEVLDEFSENPFSYLDFNNTETITPRLRKTISYYAARPEDFRRQLFDKTASVYLHLSECNYFDEEDFEEDADENSDFNRTGYDRLMELGNMLGFTVAELWEIVHKSDEHIYESDFTKHWVRNVHTLFV